MVAPIEKKFDAPIRRFTRGRIFLVAAFLITLPGFLFRIPDVGASDVSSSGGPERPRLVLLYATCTLNKSFLSPYNREVRFTPHLEAFSRSAKVFTRHRTEAGMSGIAYASIFTGRHSIDHGVFSHPERLADSNYLITEAFAEQGYDVYAWNAHPMASDDLGYMQGVPNENLIRSALTTDDAEFGRFREILARLRSDDDYRAFVVTNFTVTHAPYRDNRLDAFREAYPDECGILAEISRPELRAFKRIYYEYHDQLAFNFPETAERLRLDSEKLPKFSAYLELLYKSNVHYLDTLFGELIEEIKAGGAWQDSAIVFTADHGETLYREGAPFKWSHSHSLRSDVLDVPLMIRAPDVQPGVYEGVSRSMDVFPTMAGLAGFELPGDSGVKGDDLSARLQGEMKAPGLPAYSHSGRLPARVAELPDPLVRHLKSFYPRADVDWTWVAVREGDEVFKYKNAGKGRFRFEMYDLRRDPGETANLYDEDTPRHQSMAEKLIRYRSALIEASRIWSSIAEGGEDLSLEESLRKLRSLGYIR